MRERVDVAIVGGGAMGSSAARHLASRGRQVSVFEQFDVGHELGSSGGPTRIVRVAYHTPAYVRLARRALQEWRALQDETGEELVRVTGGLDIGETARETADALEAAGESFAYLAPEDVAERWPALRLPPGTTAVYQEETGVCDPVRTVRAQAAAARRAGALIFERTRVQSIEPSGDGAVIETADGGSVRCDVVVMAAGAWAGPLLERAGLHLALRPTREQPAHFALDGGGALPAIIDWTPDRVHTPYLVPDPFADGQFKVGHHLSGPLVDPDVDPAVEDPLRVEDVVAWTAEHVPSAVPTGRVDLCFYTTTPDEDFVLDRVGPVVIASPCSGHGFKFAPLFGSLIADLATGVRPPVDLSAFRADRPGLTRVPRSSSSTA